MFLSMVLEQISIGLGQERLQFLHYLADSMFLSVDVGHAYHPNYGEKMDPTNHSILNQGFCIKEASSQSYATDSQAVAVIEQILIYLALVLTVVSLLDYLIKNWKVMDDGKM